MIKVIVFAPPGMSVSLEREGAVSAEDFKALQQTVTNLSSGYSNIQNWITQHQVNHPTNDGISQAITAATSPLIQDINALKLTSNPVLCAGVFAVDGTLSAYSHIGIPFTYNHNLPNEVTVTHNYGSDKYGVIALVGTYDGSVDLTGATVDLQRKLDNSFTLNSQTFVGFLAATVHFIMYRTT